MSIKNLMTTKVISIRPDAPLVEAVDLLLRRGITGLPVIDGQNHLVGILTDYDLTIRGSSIHLPTFLKLLKEFDIYKKDKGWIREDIKKILNMRVTDAMNPEPLVLADTSSIEDVAQAFSEHHRVNPIPIIDNQRKLVGIISRYDLIKLMAAPSVSFQRRIDSRAMDKNVNQFLNDFERQFVFVSRYQTHYWFIWSVVFAFVGFFIAFALILRIH